MFLLKKLKNIYIEQENKALYEDLITEVRQNTSREDKVLNESESLKKYFEKMERNNETDKNWKNLSKVSPTTRQRKIIRAMN